VNHEERQEIAAIASEAATRASLIGQISALKSTVDILEARIAAIVRQARISGLTWQQVAEGLGTSSQGAQQRYGRTNDA